MIYFKVELMWTRIMHTPNDTWTNKLLTLSNVKNTNRTVIKFLIRLS